MAAIRTMKCFDKQKEPAALIFSKAAGQKWTYGYACYTTTFFLLPSCGRLFYMCILQVQSYFEVKSILLICKGKEAGLLQMWQTSHYDDYCWDLMVSTIAISCKRFAGLRTARKEVNNTIPIINASGKIGILHAVPQKFVMRLAKTTQCIGSPMIQPKIIPLTAYVIASATIIFMSC